MVTGAKNYNVLIQVQSQNEAERLIGLFRSAGIATRAHRVTSEQDFSESLKADSWDLLVTDNRHPEVSLQFSLDTIAKQKLRTPVILLADDTSADFLEQAFDLGIDDVIAKSNDDHFIHAARREMTRAQLARQLELLSAEYTELNDRAEKLLSESNDAIAYVADGIIMQCNDTFADVFGYSSPDDLDCASIIDMVGKRDHERFKNFFKHFSKGELEQAELAFEGLRHNKETFDAHMTLANASIEGEPCTQVIISTTGPSGASAGGTGNTDAATDLFNRYYLADQIASTAIQVTNGIFNASLLVYELDDHDKLRSEFFLSGIDAIIQDLAKHLNGELGSGELIARLGDNSIAVILQKAPEAALKFAKESLKNIENHICELQGRTVQFTCCCAVLHLNNKDAVELLDNGIEALDDIHLQHDKNHAAIFTPKAKAKPKASADDLHNIAEALESDSFRLLFQPIMSLQGDHKENYEATIWLMDSDREFYPEDMIKAANDTKLDRWIILEATKALAIHHAGGHKTRLIINLTVNALSDESLPAWVGVAIKAANLTADDVVFQFNEADVKNNLKAAIHNIPAFQKAGFKVSITNFGQDDDPFKLLKHIKLDMARINKRFTAMLNGDTSELKELLLQAKEHNIATILPEVDNASALATLWQLGTHYIQGSYLQSPSPVMNYEFAEIA